MALSDNDSGGTFEASSLAKWFHYAPHRDFQFEGTTTIFTPSDRSYNEALFMLAIFIGSFGVILFILLLLFYTCCFCLTRKRTKLPRDTFHARKTCYQNIIFTIGLVCSAAIIAGFVCNGLASDGVDDFCNAVDEIQKNLNDASSMGSELERNLQGVSSLIIDDLVPHDIAQDAADKTSEMLNCIEYLNGIIPVHVGNGGSDFGADIHHYDNYRWLVTVSLFTWCLFLCVFCFWTRCQTTGCIMVMLVIFSFSSMILTWVVMGADFGIATGTADFCVNPGRAIKNMTDTSDPIETAVIDYYLKCSQFNPFNKDMLSFQNNFEDVSRIITDIHANYPQFASVTSKILRDLQIVGNHVSIYKEDYSCSKIHKEYMDALDGLCNKTLLSLAVVILSLFSIGIFSGLLTCCVCPLWGHRKSYYRTYPNVEANVGDGQDDVLWWPDGLDDHFDYRARQPVNNQQTEETPLMAQYQPPNYDTVNSSFRAKPSEVASKTPLDEQDHFGSS